MPQLHSESRTVLGPPRGELGLRICGTSRDGQVVRLRSGKCSVGSDARCTLRLRSRSVRRWECLILRGENGAAIKNLSGGALLNGRRFDAAPLAAGDRLSIGAIEFEVLPGEASGERLGSDAAELARFDLASHAEALAQERAALCSEQAEWNARRAESDLELARQAEQLASRDDAIDRRERELNTQAEELDRLRAEYESACAARQEADARTAAEFDEQQTQLAAREAELTEAAQQLRGRAHEPQAAAPAPDVDGAWRDMLVHKQAWEQSRLVAEGQFIDRVNHLDEKQSQLEAERSEFDAQRAAWQAERETTAAQLHQQAERLSYQQAEWEAQRAALAAERAAWEMEAASSASQATLAAPADPIEDEVLDRLRLLAEETAERPAASQYEQEPDPNEVTEAGLRTVEKAADGDEESIEDYMARLLNRVRGAAPSEPAPRRVAPAKRVAKKPVRDEQNDEQPSQQQATIEAASEPVSAPPIPSAPPAPRVGPPETTDLAAMRELANEQARAAISRHARSFSLRGPIGLGVLSGTAIAVSLAAFFLRSAGDVLTQVVAIAGLAVAGYWAYQCYKALRRYRHGILMRGVANVTQVTEEVAQCNADAATDSLGE